VSKIKNMSRAGWLIAGVVAALVLVPTVAVAATVTVVTLKGSPSGNKADVTGAGQLLTATANPSSFFQNASLPLPSSAGGGGSVAVATPPAGLALVVTTIHINVFSDPSPGLGYSVAFYVSTGTCPESFVGSYDQVVTPASVQEIDVPLAPGLGIPAGDALCGAADYEVGADASVSGYTVPSDTVTSGPLHRLPALRRQR
jgi:hypothetical protein